MYVIIIIIIISSPCIIFYYHRGVPWPVCRLSEVIGFCSLFLFFIIIIIFFHFHTLNVRTLSRATGGERSLNTETPR